MKAEESKRAEEEHAFKRGRISVCAKTDGRGGRAGRDFRRNEWYISVIMWGTLLSIFVSLLIFLHWNTWKVFLLGIPGQAAIFLWFRMYRPKEEAANG